MAKRYYMANKTDDTNPPAREHSVTSRPSKTVTLNVPAFRRPSFNAAGVVRRVKASSLIAVLVVALLGGFLGGWAESRHNGQTGVLSGNLSAQQKVVTSESQLVNTIAKTVGASVVSVNVTSQAATQNYFGF